MALLLISRGAPPPLEIVIPLFLLMFFGTSQLTFRLLGIRALYQAFPADRSDPIEQNLGWIQIEFGAWRGHTPMSVKAGRRCLHLKQPFPFQPMVWLGPASIPWEQVRLIEAIGDDRWAFWKAAVFELGPENRRIRLRGRAARTLQALLEARQGRAQAPPVPVSAIRPR
ncbi:MAG TPA: hypothetical protein VK150_08235 [Geothrix sp.]|nr:hypothetical protein [Geothrix sp.]